MILSGQASPASSYKSASPFAAAAAAAAGSSPLAGPPHRPKPAASPGVPAVQQYGFGTAATSGAGAPRQGTAPIAIPGRSCSRVRSLHDLKPAADLLAEVAAEPGGGEHLSAAELQQQRLRLAPSSAPAATRGLLGQMLSSTKAGLAGSEGRAQATTAAAHPAAAAAAPAAAPAAAAAQPAAPEACSPSQRQLQRQPSPASTPQQLQQQLVRYSSLRPEPPANPFTAYSTSLGAAFSAEGSSGGFPSSPQLPFAMTPSAGPSMASLMMVDGAPASFPGGGQQQLLPLPVISGRDISAMATIKRPSWSSR